MDLRPSSCLSLLRAAITGVRDRAQLMLLLDCWKKETPEGEKQGGVGNVGYSKSPWSTENVPARRKCVEQVLLSFRGRARPREFSGTI